MNQYIQALRAALPKLDARSQTFGESLILQYESRGRLSDRQWHFVQELARRADEPPPEATDVGSVKGVVDLLERAAKHLKRPAIVVRANGQDIRLNIAGAAAKVPGSINVCSVGRFDERQWYGRVTREGQFEPSRRIIGRTQMELTAALTAMATDPAKAAAEYGHLTGVCCFCGRKLDDDRSTQIGYGPVCAKHYGLPWGRDVKAAATWHPSPDAAVRTALPERAPSEDQYQLPARRICLNEHGCTGDCETRGCGVAA